MGSAAGPVPRVVAVVLVDDGESPDPTAAVALAAWLASAAGTRAEAVLVGRTISDDAVASALSQGAARVRAIEHPGLSGSSGAADLLEVLMPHLDGAGAAVVLVPYGATSEELAARAAARTGGQALGRCAALEAGPGGVSATKAVVGGRVAARLTATRWPVFASVGRGPDVAGPAAGPEAVVERTTSDARLPSSAHVVRAPASADRYTKVVGAKLVVCGGRGIGGPEGFDALRDLAVHLGGAFGGSLPTVDAGWVPVAQQIGQSGHYVTADLYVGVGVSGTAQHMAGISPSTRIVAINNDPEADIFRVADVGVVGDWKVLLPLLIEHLREGGG